MPAIDPYANFNQTPASPAIDAFAITPNDSTDLTTIPRSLNIGVGGALKVTTMSGTTLVLTVAAGVLPLRVTRVWATGTTATNIAGLV